MKQKDIALIVVAGIVSAIISVVLSNLLIAPQKNRQQKAEVVDAITTDFKLPDPKYFNKNTSINPTQRITIGDSGNNAPFDDKKQ